MASSLRRQRPKGERENSAGSVLSMFPPWAGSGEAPYDSARKMSWIFKVPLVLGLVERPGDDKQRIYTVHLLEQGMPSSEISHAVSSVVLPIFTLVDCAQQDCFESCQVWW